MTSVFIVHGIYWREENAEGMLVLRAAVLTGRWAEVMAATHEAMREDRRRDWKWIAPDMVAELNSGAAIMPPVPQPESSDQTRAIAA